MGRKIVSGFEGKMGRLFLAGNEFCAEDYNWQEEANEEDTSNTCGAGYAEQEFGVRRITGSINATWDASVNPFTDPPDFFVGAKYITTKLYIHSAPGVGLESGPFLQLTLQVGSGLSVTIPVKGKVAVTIPFMSFGTYILPATEVSASS